MRKPQAALGFIFITILIDVIGIGIIIPVIPSLILELTGKGLSDASTYGGWLMFSYAIMQFIFSPVLGSLSDKFGRRPVILISLFGLGVDFIIHAVAPTIAWLFVGRLLAGIAGASMTTATAYIADISPPEKRAQNFGLIGAAFGLGFIVGPMLGGILSEWGTRVPFWAASGLSFLNFLYGYIVLPESLKKENRRNFTLKRANPIGSLLHLRKNKTIAGMAAVIFLLYMAGHSIQSTWTFYTMLKFDWDEKMVGYSLGFVGFLVAFIQGYLIRIVNRKLGAVKSIFIGFAFSALGLALIAFAQTTTQLFIVIVPYCLGGLAGPAVQAMMSNQVPSSEQGELQGAITSLTSLTSIFGPLLMTGIFHYFTDAGAEIYFPGAPYILAVVLVFMAMFFTFRSLKTRKSA